MLAANRQATAGSPKTIVEDYEHRFGCRSPSLKCMKTREDCDGTRGRQEVEYVVFGVLCVAFD